MQPSARRAPANEALVHNRVQVGASVVLLVALIFAVDASFRWVAFGGFYAIPILLSLWLRSARVTLAVTVVCCLLTLGEVVWLASREPEARALETFTLAHLFGSHAVEIASLVIVCLIGTWRVRDERVLEESRETTQATLASIAEAVITVDSARRITYLNPTAELLTGVALANAVGRPVQTVVLLRDQRPLVPPIDDLPDLSSAPRISRAWLRSAAGPELRVEVVESPLRGPAGQRRGEVIVFRDVTERERHEHDMRTLAYRDTLTRLPNRLALSELLGLELAHARRNRGSLAVLFLDLDDFKRVNDTLGHAAGDELLRATAQRLRANLRETDTIARLGGDEFAIVLPGAQSPQDVEQIAAKLIGALDEPVVFEGRAMHARASMGLAMFPEDAADADGLLRRADEAMYRAKQDGGGRLASSSSSSTAAS